MNKDSIEIMLSNERAREEKEKKAFCRLEKAYIDLLSMPTSKARIQAQGVLCAARDTIAAIKGMDSQVVQDYYEDLVRRLHGA